MKKILLPLMTFLVISLCHAQNNPPVIDAINDLAIDEGMIFSVSLNAWDEDSSQKIDNPVIVILGSSTAAGRGASDGNGWVDLFENYLASNFNSFELRRLVKSGHTSYHFRETGYTPTLPGRPLPDPSWNITRAMTYNPDLIIVNLPSNDVANGFDRQETYDNFNAIKSIAEAGGSQIVFHTTQPRNFNELSQRLELFDKSNDIKSIFAPDTVNTYDFLVNTSDYRIRNEFNADDIHVNDAGHQVIYNRTIDGIDKYLFGDKVSLSVSGLPQFASFQTTGNGTGEILSPNKYLSMPSIVLL
jgi:lysophospholipase L1-like esterase